MRRMFGVKKEVKPGPSIEETTETVSHLNSIHPGFKVSCESLV
jgi:hypothetical protein